MTIKVPSLETRFLEPPGWRWHYLKNKHGAKLRFGTAYPESRIPSAVVVLLPGRSEYAEKYFEVARDLLKNNLSVWILEWQGQGLSDRFLSRTPGRNHSHPFSDYVEDLHEFILQYVKHACVHPDVGRIPMVMLAQSMGGNIGLRYLHAHPGMFESAAFCAPMLGLPSVDKIRGGGLLVRALSFLAGKSYAFGQNDWALNKEGFIFSSDPVRSKIHETWQSENESLRLGGVTFGWVYHAWTSSLFLKNPEVLQSIQTPMLIAIAEQENLVDNEATRRAAALIPQARFVELEGSGHEILMERDEIRNKFLEAFFQLIKETVIDRPESLKTF